MSQTETSPKGQKEKQMKGGRGQGLNIKMSQTETSPKGQNGKK